MNTEKNANALVESISHYNGSLADALADELPGELFYEAAVCIVEPEGVCDEYVEFVEDDTDNWAQWITTVLGEDWGKVAKKVAEEGY